MEADGLRVREPANQGAEVRERQGRPVLVVEPDGRGRERLGVGRRESRSRLELAFGRDGSKRLLKGCAAQKPGLNRARRLGEARDERREVRAGCSGDGGPAHAPPTANRAGHALRRATPWSRRPAGPSRRAPARARAGRGRSGDSARRGSAASVPSRRARLAAPPEPPGRSPAVRSGRLRRAAACSFAWRRRFGSRASRRRRSPLRREQRVPRSAEPGRKHSSRTTLANGTKLYFL